MATIVDFDDLRHMLELEKNSFNDYPDLEIIADSVHSALESYVGRGLGGVATLTESISAASDRYVDLTNLPISAIKSVFIDGELIDAEEYSICEYGIKFTINKSGQCKIASKGGFKIMPTEIYRAELFQIVYEYQNKNNLAVKYSSNDGGSTSTPGFVILDHVKGMLSKYMHINKLGY